MIFFHEKAEKQDSGEGDLRGPETSWRRFALFKDAVSKGIIIVPIPASQKRRRIERDICKNFGNLEMVYIMSTHILVTKTQWREYTYPQGQMRNIHKQYSCEEEESLGFDE